MKASRNFCLHKGRRVWYNNKCSMNSIMEMH